MTDQFGKRIANVVARDLCYSSGYEVSLHKFLYVDLLLSM